MPESGFKRIGSSPLFFAVVCGCFIACVIFIGIALHLWGAVEVRTDGGENLFVTFFGLIWLVISRFLFFWFGLSVRDDVVAGGNPAALFAFCGGWIAMAFIYVGGSVGEGPSYSENVFSCGLGAAAFFALWLVLELGARVSVSITEERDLASGLRLAAFQLSIGLILARALAGNWHSAANTLHDFWQDGWLALPLLGIALFGEWFLRPSGVRPFPSGLLAGLLPALMYLALAIGWVWRRGPWEGMPK